MKDPSSCAATGRHLAILESPPGARRPMLHVIISPREWLRRGPGRLATEAARAGVDYLHLRLAGEINLRRALELGRELSTALTPTHRCRLVVNDRVDLALALGVDALQLPEHSFSIAETRTLLAGASRAQSAGRYLIGASRHGPAGVEQAARDGADWVFLGHLYPTRSHPGQPPLASPVIEAALEAAGATPVIAIGGISAASAAPLLDRGFGGVAVLGAVFGPGGVYASLGAIRTALDHAWRRKQK